MGKILSFITGRDEKESDVYANYDRVAEVVSQIQSIGKNEIQSAKEDVHQAIEALNNVNGLAQFVGSIDAGVFDGQFDAIAEQVAQIGTQIQEKADSIKAYEESAWYEKLGSTFCMAGAKVGEGLLSVVEGIGDGVVSVVGWVAPKDSGVEKWCGKFVEKNWSHDAFNGYYNSEFAKKSLITEDSGAAGALKITGSAVGYLALGGVTAGAGGAIAARTAGSVSKAGKIAKAAGTFMQSTTRANTAIAAISGMGAGTESGLKQGLSFDDAAKVGVKQGAKEAAIAGVMGKLGERGAKKADIKRATKELEEAKSVASKFANTGDDYLTGSFSKSAESSAKVFADDAVNTAEKNLSKIKSTKLNKYQGYSDPVTKSGQKIGDKIGNKYVDNVVDKGIIKGTLKTATDPVKSGVNKVASGASNVKKSVQTFRQEPIANAKTLASSAKKSVGTNLKNAGSTALNKTTNLGKTALSAARHPIKTTGKVVGTTLKTAKTVATSPATPGIAAMTVNSNLNTKTNSTDQFKLNVNPEVKGINPPTGEEISKRVPFVETSTNNSSNKSSGGSSSGGSTGGSSGGGSSAGGGGGGASSGGGSSSPSNGNSYQQFKRSDTTDNNDKNKQNTGKAKNSTPTQTPTPTKKPTSTTTPSTSPQTPTNNTPQQTTPTPSKPDQSTTTPSNQPTQTTPGNNNVVTQPSNSGTSQTTQHTGGGYSGSSGYKGYSGGGTTGASTGSGTATSPSTVKDVVKGSAKTSIDDVIKGSKYTKIPTSSKPITATPTGGSGGSAVIPVVAGLSAAAAAGIGAKVYMDRKRNNENGEYDDIETEEWSGEDSLNIDYDDSSDTETYLDADDDYGYQAEEQIERYDARNNEELADLQ